MLSRVSERKMVSVRAVLFLGWLGLIASLFWDPMTPMMTQPDCTWSPFHIEASSETLRGETFAVEPYHLTNRIFWTMLIPIFPLFLMVFGHEAWRRICPLSFASQLPRYFGLRRQRMILQRRTGLLEPALALIPRDGWLHRNAWYVQFGLLFVGLCSRLLFLNSDRTALAVGLILVIAAAITVGYLWGGKSWCNYFCPANIVQRIYTEPRGLLESKPHIHQPAIPQSMCRTPTPDGDKSACVGCVASCGDIDLERSYWEGIKDPARRNVYYMFFGLIIGFYGYYYLYSATWSYYFSGIWTHESNQLGAVMKPGLFIANRPIAIPKLFAVPLVLGVSAAAALGLGKILEAGYRRLCRARKDMTEEKIINRCLAVSAFVSINTFYVFGGRPNLLMLPNVGMICVDVVIFWLSALWLWQALERSPFKYRRESLASSLAQQFKELKIDVGRYSDGRSVDELNTDEICILGKVLPPSPPRDR
jgi:4Fe-4S binding domain